MKIIHLAAARPNFMKVAPLFRKLEADSSVDQILVHTGQHYDANLSDIFFTQLRLSPPDVHLQVKGSNREEQISLVKEKLIPVIKSFKPDYLVVVGDVNPTLGGALAAKDTLTRLVHVESGLRSFDQSMPEEVNRIATDQLSDLLFVTEEAGMFNLKNEGIKGTPFFVGNIMIDSLIEALPEIGRTNHRLRYNLEPKDYAVCTFHRPANVDNLSDLKEVLKCIEECQKLIKILFPLHPRTRGSLVKHNLMNQLSCLPNVILTDPLGYHEFMSLILDAKAIITDSGGIQEESTYLKIPCLTIRDSTERPVTLKIGSNQLLKRDANLCQIALKDIIKGKKIESTVPPLWDGKTAERIANILKEDFKTLRN